MPDCVVLCQILGFNYITDVPTEVFLGIVLFMEPKDVLSLRAVSRYTNTAISSFSRFWIKRVLYHDFRGVTGEEYIRYKCLPPDARKKTKQFFAALNNCSPMELFFALQRFDVFMQKNNYSECYQELFTKPTKDVLFVQDAGRQLVTYGTIGTLVIYN